MLHEAAALSNIDQQNLSQLNASLNTLVDSLGKIEQLEGVDTLTSNETWQAGKTSLLSQIDANQAQFFSLNSTIITSRLNKLESVRHYIEYLPETTGLETNFKTLLLLKVKQQSGDEWTPSDIAALRAIAYSCPATGGEAVTIAREMLPSPEAYSFGREGADPLCGEGFQGNGEDKILRYSIGYSEELVQVCHMPACTSSSYLSYRNLPFYEKKNFIPVFFNIYTSFIQPVKK